MAEYRAEEPQSIEHWIDKAMMLYDIKQYKHALYHFEKILEHIPATHPDYRSYISYAEHCKLMTCGEHPIESLDFLWSKVSEHEFKMDTLFSNCLTLLIACLVPTITLWYFGRMFSSDGSDWIDSTIVVAIIALIVGCNIGILISSFSFKNKYLGEYESRKQLKQRIVDLTNEYDTRDERLQIEHNRLTSIIHKLETELKDLRKTNANTR